MNDGQCEHYDHYDDVDMDDYNDGDDDDDGGPARFCAGALELSTIMTTMMII